MLSFLKSAESNIQIQGTIQKLGTVAISDGERKFHQKVDERTPIG